jgi:hypothetical protein
MKKLLLTVFALTWYLAVNAQCNELFISQYVEGTNNNKALDIYNPTPNAINMNNQYRLVRYANGTSAAAAEVSADKWINLGSHVIPSGHTWTLVLDKRDSAGTGLELMVLHNLYIKADTFVCPVYATNNAMYINGNDAWSIMKTNDGGATWHYVDIIGMMGDAAMTANDGTGGWGDIPPYDGSAGGAIWTKDHTLIRKATIQQGVTTNPSPEFVVNTEWDSLPKNTFDSLGFHRCTCVTAGITENGSKLHNVNLYPNPASGNVFTITSTENMEAVEVFDLVGRNVMTREIPRHQNHGYSLSYNLAQGLYNVRVRFDDGTSRTTKLSVR